MVFFHIGASARCASSTMKMSQAGGCVMRASVSRLATCTGCQRWRRAPPIRTPWGILARVRRWDMSATSEMPCTPKIIETE